MFKHKDRRAMNSNACAVLPNSAAKSVKLNARNLKGLKKETRSLAQESDEMEEKLKLLKEKMSQEKEERAQSGSCTWKSGQQGPLNSAVTLINPRRLKDTKLQKLSTGKVKIRVLTDKHPTAKPPPPSPATAAPKPTGKSKLKGIACGQCEVRTAGVKCVECSEDYCIGCFSKFHQKGALKLHSIVPFQTELQTHVSARDVVSSSSSLQTLTPNPSCYTTTFSNPNPRPNSTHNHGRLSDAVTDQRPANAVTAQHALNQDNSSQILTVHPEENNSLKSETEPSLLNGTYDEEESTKSFQDALRQWRETGPTPAQEPMWTPPHPAGHHSIFNITSVADVPTQADLSPGGGGAEGRVPVRVEFSEHGLTLLDRLLLKKHRRNPIELPPLTDPHVKPLPKSPAKDPEACLTAEDKEVHTYLTSLFALPTNAKRSGLDNSTPGVCLTIEDLDEEDRDVHVEAKRTVNRIIPSHQIAGPKNMTSKTLSPRTTQQLILSRETVAVFSALSKPELTADTPGDRGTSIKTATSESTKTRSPTSHKDKSPIESPLSPALSPSTPLPRPPKPSHSPFSFRPNDSPSAGRSFTSEERDSYPKISPVLRTTFTLTPSSSFDSELLPKISARQKPSGSDVKSSKPFQNSLSDLDAVQSDEEKTISPSPSKLCSRNSCAESPQRSLALSRTRSRLSGDTAVCRTSQHETTGRESMSKQHKQHFLSDLSVNDNSGSVLTGKHQVMSTVCAKESTFALIREYHNALKSIQDSDDEMSSDSLDLALCEDDSADEDSGAQTRTHNRRSTDDRASSARASSHTHEEGKRDLPADEAQQLSEPVQVIRSWSDCDDSGDDMPPPRSNIYPNLRLKSFDALHQHRTSLDSSTSTDWSEEETQEVSGADQSGCEDPDMEADATEHTVSRLEMELRMLVEESRSEVFTVAPGNSRTENPRGSRHCTRRRMSKEEEDEEEAAQNDQKSVLLLP